MLSSAVITLYTNYAFLIQSIQFTGCGIWKVTKNANHKHLNVCQPGVYARRYTRFDPEGQSKWHWTNNQKQTLKSLMCGYDWVVTVYAIVCLEQ